MTEAPQLETNEALYDSMDDFAREFYGHLRDTGRVFRRNDGSITFIDSAIGPRRILGLDEFRSMASSLLNLRISVGRRSDRPTILTRDQGVFLFGHEKRKLLPEIRYVLTEPAVATIRGEPYLIAKPGFHDAVSAYYWRKPDSPAIEPLESVEHLLKCFSGVPFFGPENRNNVLAWLVSGMSLDPDVNPPMLTVTGNDRGVGKSSLVQACGYILTGQMQNAIRPTGSEFEKQLGAKFAEEQRFIMLDNVTTGVGRSFSQPALARLLTEGKSKAVRLLGQSRNVSQTGVLFALTANDCKLDQDLATRSLTVQLHRDRPGPMIPYVLRYAQQHRPEIYGELLGLALRRQETKIPGEYSTCRFVDWIQYVVPIIVPHFGPLAISQSEDLDDRVQDLFAWGVDHVDKPFTADDLYSEIMGNPEAWPGLWGSVVTARGERGRKTKLALFISNMVGRHQHFGADAEIYLERTGAGVRSGTSYIFKERSTK